MPLMVLIPSAAFLFFMIRVCDVLRAAPNTFSPEKSHRKNAFLTVNALYHYGPSCEKRSPENPQIFRASFITNNFSAKNSHSARGGYSKSKIRFFPRLKDRHLHWGVEPVFPALHDCQMRPAFLTEALDHGAAGQGIPVTIQHLRAAMPVQRMFPHPAQIRL